MEIIFKSWRSKTIGNW